MLKPTKRGKVFFLVLLIIFGCVGGFVGNHLASVNDWDEFEPQITVLGVLLGMIIVCLFIFLIPSPSVANIVAKPSNTQSVSKSCTICGITMPVNQVGSHKVSLFVRIEYPHCGSPASIWALRMSIGFTAFAAVLLVMLCLAYILLLPPETLNGPNAKHVSNFMAFFFGCILGPGLAYDACKANIRRLRVRGELRKKMPTNH